jgi:hypothetical protein
MTLAPCRRCVSPLDWTSIEVGGARRCLLARLVVGLEPEVTRTSGFFACTLLAYSRRHLLRCRCYSETGFGDGVVVAMGPSAALNIYIDIGPRRGAIPRRPVDNPLATNCRPPDQTSIFLFSSDGRHAVDRYNNRARELRRHASIYTL